MAEEMEVHAREVRNLVNGNVAGDQIGGSKVGGDQVAGNKLTVEMRNVIFDPAIISEFGLNPSDISDDIQRIGQLVCSMILTELKDNLSRQSSSTVVGLSQTRRALEEFHTLRYTGAFETSTRVPDVKLSDLLPPMVDLQSTFRYYIQTRNVRRRKEGDTLCLLRKSRQLHAWSGQAGSSQLLVKGSFRTRHMLRDFAADIIELLQKEGRSVVWILQRRGAESNLLDTSDVLKQLVSQILQQRTRDLDELTVMLTARRLQDATTIDDWFNLLGSLLGDVKELYLLFDTTSFGEQAQQYQWGQAFARLFDQLQKRNIPTTIRTIFISSRPALSRQLQTDLDTVIDLSSSHSVQQLQSRPLLPLKRIPQV
ncbi:hypothetical protein AbraIFM66951_002455 [Aspergillus brasiliensis]|uniref:Uncharacterized protein n=1 Tax=Aspergillus brasiliensis TaxID=319629 RepID=A0A9W5YYM6_9EURO|nr:hypothetical protein AbraCBS73388_001747 [Aspergillus brasiliensis]GKZ49750.1 hypothetical protein AbraIFM66951_002455 [Aspergillus brasiliensis]